MEQNSPALPCDFANISDKSENEEHCNISPPSDIPHLPYESEVHGEVNACLGTSKIIESQEQDLISPLRRVRNITLSGEFEIHGELSLYIAPDKVIESYNSIEHYLGTHFHLMKEDMLRFLQCGITEYKKRKFQEGNVANLGKEQIYFIIKIQSQGYCSNDEFFVSSGFYVSSWRNEEILESEHDILDLTKCYFSIETDALYKGHSHVLKKLEFFNTTKFPLSSFIVFFKPFDEKPLLLELENASGSNGNDACATKDEVLNKRLANTISTFDAYQRKAFLMALSCKMSLIQGPPGTGKTFLGLQIVKWFSQNSPKYRSTPILFVCCTNQALDQFLEGALNFTEKILRIGGESESEVLKPHDLKNVANAFLTKSKRCRVTKSQELFCLLSGRKRVPESSSVRQVSNCNQHSQIVKKLEDKLNNLERVVSDLNNVSLTDECLVVLFPYIRELQTRRYEFPMSKDKMCEWVFSQLERWLCLTPFLNSAYETTPKIHLSIIEELFHYVNACTESHKDEFNSPSMPIGNGNSFFRKTFCRFLNRWKYNMNRYTIFFNDPVIKNRILYFLSKVPVDMKTVFNLIKTALINHVNVLEQDLNSVDQTEGVWSLNLIDRWRLLFLWVRQAKRNVSNVINSEISTYKKNVERHNLEKCELKTSLLKNADVIGLTTTEVDKHWKLLEDVGPKIVIVEEVAEELEAHVMTSLMNKTEHLIFIGDHKQLMPNPTVCELAKSYNLSVSMFERLLNNGTPSVCLQVQHRMRPCIAEILVPEVYYSLQNHPCVSNYEDIRGVQKNIYFINHAETEEKVINLHSYENMYEATYIVNLCIYLFQQGYTAENITILTPHIGQVMLLKNMMYCEELDRLKVTTIDNFLGKESDIILLSFVRSNFESTTKFVRKAIRSCVALSRARKALYCIGNFRLLATHCEVWRKIISKAKLMQVMSNSLPLKCQKHPEKITLVASAEDFEKVSLGGCSEKCISLHSCGHPCTRDCHPSEDHDESFCTECEKIWEDLEEIEIAEKANDDKIQDTGRKHTEGIDGRFRKKSGSGQDRKTQERTTRRSRKRREMKEHECRARSKKRRCK